MGIPKNELSKRENIALKVLCGLFGNATVKISFIESEEDLRDSTHEKMIKKSFEVADKFLKHCKSDG